MIACARTVGAHVLLAYMRFYMCSCAMPVLCMRARQFFFFMDIFSIYFLFYFFYFIFLFCCADLLMRNFSFDLATTLSLAACLLLFLLCYAAMMCCCAVLLCCDVLL